MTSRPHDPLPLLRFVELAQELGFTFDQIEALVRLDPDDVPADLTRVIAAKLELVDEKLRDLKALRRMFADMVAEARARRRASS
jgi:DNA-binding transcriptional MerR regulator